MTKEFEERGGLIIRILIEHTIKHLKSYRSIGTIWRHPQWFQLLVVELCTFLAQRHVVLFNDI